jgi:hypothetical protein
VNNNFKHAVKTVEVLKEQLSLSIWTDIERSLLNMYLQFAQSDVRIIKANLRTDGFGEATVDALERQFIMEFMEGNPS